MSSDVHLSQTDEPGSPLTDHLSDALTAFSHPYRSTVLSVLYEAERPLSSSTLAERVLARIADVEPTDAEDVDRRAVRISLHHTHLPKLADRGLLEWDRSADAAALTADPETRSWLDSLLESETTVYDDVEALLCPRRRAILAVVLSRDEPISLSALATAVATRTSGTTESAVDRLSVLFHHADLPALADAGVLEYDDREGTVSPETAPIASE